ISPGLLVDRCRKHGRRWNPLRDRHASPAVFGGGALPVASSRRAISSGGPDPARGTDGRLYRPALHHTGRLHRAGALTGEERGSHLRQKVRCGIIGCGGIANHFHLRDLAGIREAQLLACADVRPEAARATAERWGAKAWYADHGDLLRRDDVDAVIVATYHPTHASIGCDV